MKKIILVFLLASINLLNGQASKPFSKLDFGFYGGINFYDSDNIGSDIFIEFKTNLLTSFSLKVSTGFVKSSQSKFYTVKRYSEKIIDNTPRFFASKYNVIGKRYDVFPISLGIQYNLYESNISPYFTIDMVYNFINTFIDFSTTEHWTYNSIDEIPSGFSEDYKREELYENSYGVILGVGASYPISSKLNLDFRYLFKLDNEIINTHHFILGVLLEFF